MSEPNKTVPGMRRFMVFTCPHSGDPSWLNPVVELDDSTTPATPIEYQDTKILEQVMLDLSRDRARAAGYNSGAQAVLDTFGLTVADYQARKKSSKVAKKLDNPTPNDVASNNGQ